MKLLSIRLVNYAGIKSGTGLNEIFIDLERCKNNIILIRGNNGSGKSTLLNAMTPFPEPSDAFLVGLDAMKELKYDLDGTIYFIRFIHRYSNGKHQTPRASLKKSFPDGLSELNPTGNISQYKSLIEDEFELDSNFLLLSNLSNDSRGIVERTPAERMKYVMIGMSDIYVYNDINKHVSKKESYYKAQMNQIQGKINSIGNEQNVKDRLTSLNNNLNKLEELIETKIGLLSEYKAKIEIHDKSGDIQKEYQERNLLSRDIDNKINLINTFISQRLKANKFVKEIDIDTFESNLNELNNSIENISTNINGMMERYKRLSDDLNDINKTLESKIIKLNSIKSDYELDDLVRSIKNYSDKILQYETIFKDMNISNAIAITKEEYISAINTIQSIRISITSLYSNNNIQTIREAIAFIKTKSSIELEINKKVSQHRELESMINSLNVKMNEMKSKIDLISILDKRPQNCKINSCEFIREALMLRDSSIYSDMNNLSSKLNSMSEELNNSSNRLDELKRVELVIKSIEFIISSIQINSSIISKLPNTNMLLDADILLDRMAKSDTFNELNNSYLDIQYANIFEDYKTSKSQLSILENELNILQSKSDIIEELNKDIELYKYKSDKLSEEIGGIREQLTNENNKLSKLNSIKSEMDSMSKVTELIKLYDEEKDNNERIKVLEKTFSKIKDMVELSKVLFNEINQLKSQKAQLVGESRKLEFALEQLTKYLEEYSFVEKYYNICSKLKKYSSPSKKSIQQLFMSIYMNQIINTTNELLKNMFEGDLQLTECLFADNTFAIQAFSQSSNMLIDDISSCSTSEKTMISMLLGFSLMYQASSKYNIAKLDEIDFGLDNMNRMAFPQVLNGVRNMLGIEQIIMISHSIEIDSSLLDVIQLKVPETEMVDSGGNIIFKL